MSGHLDVLDKRFPKRCDEPTRCFWDLIQAWDGARDRFGDRMILGIVKQAHDSDKVIWDRYVLAASQETQPFRAITEEPRTIYRELAEEALDEVAAMGGDAA